MVSCFLIGDDHWMILNGQTYFWNGLYSPTRKFGHVVINAKSTRLVMTNSLPIIFKAGAGKTWAEMTWGWCNLNLSVPKRVAIWLWFYCGNSRTYSKHMCVYRQKGETEKEEEHKQRVRIRKIGRRKLPPPRTPSSCISGSSHVMNTTILQGTSTSSLLFRFMVAENFPLSVAGIKEIKVKLIDFLIGCSWLELSPIIANMWAFVYNYREWSAVVGIVLAYVGIVKHNRHAYDPWQNGHHQPTT